MSKQLRSMGAGFDWSREVSTIDPEYYKWTQWIFLQLYKAGLAYRAKTFVNWCPTDKTVLANEQVIDGKCFRDGTPVEQREITQWMFKITSFADRLIDDLDDLDWPESTKLAQKNWIGRSEGAKIKFPLDFKKNPADNDRRGPNGERAHIEVFTTRPDTIFGATFLVLAPEHPWVQLATDANHDVLENKDEVAAYVASAKKRTELERLSEGKDKTGIELKGVVAINPMTDKEIPIFVADYVLGNYGTGAIMAVPAHDERDYEFAKKFNLPIKQEILNENNLKEGPNEDEGVLISSNNFDGLPSAEAKTKIIQALKEKGLAEPQKNYRLHDWILSRQRYWGAPIPMIHCPECGYQPVPESELPVKLPSLKDFMPADDL